MSTPNEKARELSALAVAKLLEGGWFHMHGFDDEDAAAVRQVLAETFAPLLDGARWQDLPG